MLIALGSRIIAYSASLDVAVTLAPGIGFSLRPLRCQKSNKFPCVNCCQLLSIVTNDDLVTPGACVGKTTGVLVDASL